MYTSSTPLSSANLTETATVAAAAETSTEVGETELLTYTGADKSVPDAVAASPGWNTATSTAAMTATTAAKLRLEKMMDVIRVLSREDAPFTWRCSAFS